MPITPDQQAEIDAGVAPMSAAFRRDEGAYRQADWSGAALAAYDRLSERCDRVVIAGLSMGGSLTLWVALQRPETAGIVCVNPATVPQPAEVLEMLDEMIADGMAIVPGIGSDIADPDAVEIAYDGTPLPMIAVPVFVFMGVMLERSKLADQLLQSLAQLMRGSPGGLGMAVFALSTFTPTQRFGTLMLTLLAAALVGDLIFLGTRPRPAQSP